MILWTYVLIIMLWASILVLFKTQFVLKADAQRNDLSLRFLQAIKAEKACFFFFRHLAISLASRVGNTRQSGRVATAITGGPGAAF